MAKQRVYRDGQRWIADLELYPGDKRFHHTHRVGVYRTREEARKAFRHTASLAQITTRQQSVRGAYGCR